MKSLLIKQKAIRLYKEKIPIPEILKLCNIGRTTLYAWTKEYNIFSDRRYLNNAIKHKAIKLYKEKVPISEILRSCKISVSTLRRWLNLYKISPNRNSGVKLSYQKINDILILYKKYRNIRAVARKLNINRRTVAFYLHKSNIRVCRVDLNKEKIDKIIALYKKGLSSYNIGKKYNLSSSFFVGIKSFNSFIHNYTSFTT